MQTINGRYARGAYQTLEQLLDDMTLLCDNAYGFYSKTSKQAKVSIVILLLLREIFSFEDEGGTIIRINFVCKIFMLEIFM